MRFVVVAIAIAIVIIVLLLALLATQEHLTSDREPVIILEPDDRYEPLSKNLFKTDKKSDAKKKAENNYINSLPTSTDCADKFDDCPKWAADGECTINPEYMLYNCSKSCQSCALTPQQKFNIVKIYNSRDPEHPVYHGEDYPGTFEYTYKLYGHGF